MNSKPKKGYKKVTWMFGKEIEIPEDWEHVKLSSVTEINPITKTQKTNCKYVPMDAVSTTKPKIQYFENRIFESNSNLPRFQQNDVLFARITPSTENGKTALVEDFIGVGIASSELIVLRPKQNIIPLILFYYLKIDRIRQFATSQMMGTTNRQRVPDYVFTKDLYFELPPIYEQKKIASILSRVDALIQCTQGVIEKTERLKKGLMQKLLVRGINHTKFKKVPWLFGKEIEIPEEWELKHISELFEFLKTGTNSRNDLGEIGNVGYIHYGDIHRKWRLILDCNSAKIPFINKEKIKHISQLQNGDLIIADASEDHEGSGSSVLIKNVNNKQIVSGLHTLALRDNANNTTIEFRAYITSIPFVKKQIIAYVTGISVYGLSKTNLRNIRVPIPAFQEQAKIASILSGIDAVYIILSAIKIRMRLAIFLTFVRLLILGVQPCRKRLTQ